VRLGVLGKKRQSPRAELIFIPRCQGPLRSHPHPFGFAGKPAKSACGFRCALDTATNLDNLPKIKFQGNRSRVKNYSGNGILPPNNNTKKLCLNPDVSTHRDRTSYNLSASHHFISHRSRSPEWVVTITGICKYIIANAQVAADIKAKAAQYFTLLNRLEYVITLDPSYSAADFLSFWRKFNMLYNLMHRNDDSKDPIEVYFDEQIGIAEVPTVAPRTRRKKPTEVATGTPPGGAGSHFDVAAIIQARNIGEDAKGTLIREFKDKLTDFFRYARESDEGVRLLVKIKSHVSEDEIHADFAKIYRRYKGIYKPVVGEFFFKETADLIDKLCDEFCEELDLPADKGP
jgi:hypothetical protein